MSIFLYVFGWIVLACGGGYVGLAMAWELPAFTIAYGFFAFIVSGILLFAMGEALGYLRRIAESNEKIARRR
ncbi:hypothetical protein [Halobacillus sp. A5]|uniref:hypothetical protein n=1 Tax=Halobacillus sp. A5 TaxID=2880263 RepID=UPI0020A6B4EB|nr:hypothetical protein [Halobacillus sp. A5]MCP3029653.1 hypothetical protein [Halobacillus sp. A5]